MQKYNSRKEVPEEFKCDLTDYFKDEKDFNATYEKTIKLVKEIKKYVGCVNNPKKLYEFLKLETEISALWENMYAYAMLMDDLELGVSKNITMKNKVENLNTTISTSVAFFTPELLKLPKEEYDNLFVICPELREYKENLDKIYREKDHVLSKKEEVIISELASVINSYEDISSNLLNKQHNYGKIKIDDEKITISNNNYISLMRSSDEQIRKKIYLQYNKKIDEYSDTNASLLNNFVTMNNKVSKIRKFKDAWDANLFNLNLSDKVFKTLVSTTENNLEVLHKYYKIKSEILGVDKLRMYDLYLNPDKSNKEYSINEAQSIIRNALMPLGEEYIKKYDKVINDKHIDYCQYKGKRSGGYSIGTMLNDSRIMMSYNYDLDSISTIAHEAGHDINLQFISENNPLQYRSFYPIVAEVASLTNECLLSNYLLNNGTSKEEKLAALTNIIRVIVANLFGAVREGKIEQTMYNEVSKGNAITKEFMDKLTKKSLKKYYGESVKLDKYSKNSWVTMSHYYMDFYLYSYAICICVATNIADKIINKDQDMFNKYQEFLKAGYDKWPSELFAILGIDLEDPKVYENAINYFNNLIDKYYEIYNQEEV